MTTNKQLASMDEYIQTLPGDVQEILQKIRQIVQKVVPDAQETISYNMPTFTVDGKLLVHFAAWKNHIALYHIPAGDEAFQQELAPYVNDKGAVLLPLNKPIPYDLVEKIIRVRVQQKLDD